MTRLTLTAAALALALVGPAAAATPPPGQPTFVGFTGPVPADWVAEKPSTEMRLVQYRIPGPGDAEPATLVVYYFGVGQGGSVEANVARWRAQFTANDGGPVEPRVERVTSGAMPLTEVELRGSYARRAGFATGVERRPDQVLLSAIVESPKGALHVQLHGPAITVDAARPGFEAFVRGIVPVAPEEPRE
jgi:hypothetical protein